MNYEENIDQFITVAREYCAWLDSVSQMTDDDVFQAQKYIAALYSNALLLPGVNGDYLTRSFDEPTVSLEAKRSIVEKLGNFPFRYYWELFHPVTEKPEEPLYADLADDLVDIYADVKEGLLVLDKYTRPDAVFHWSTTFGFHWGRHATSALRALHTYDPDTGL